MNNLQIDPNYMDRMARAGILEEKTSLPTLDLNNHKAIVDYIIDNICKNK